MTLDERLARELDRPPLDDDPDRADRYRARAASIERAWPLERGLLRSDEELATTGAGPVLAAWAAVRGRHTARPGHGAAHAGRCLAASLAMAVADGLDEGQALRASLGAVSHDLGRFLVERDSPAIRHAEVSAVVFETAAVRAALPAELLAPVRYAILAHTAESDRYDVRTYRCVDDVRTADRVDIAGATGLVRRLLFDGPECADAAFAPTLEPGTLLTGFRRFGSAEHPTLASRWGRAERAERWAWAEELLARLPSLAGDAASIETHAARLVAGVEPGASPAPLVAALRRLRPDEQETWAGILAELATRLGTEHQRLEGWIEGAAAAGGTVASVASVLRRDAARLGLGDVGPTGD